VETKKNVSKKNENKKVQQIKSHRNKEKCTKTNKKQLCVALTGHSSYSVTYGGTKFIFCKLAYKNMYNVCNTGELIMSIT